MNASIEETQRKIAQTLGLDRSSLWQLSDDRRSFVLTYRWQHPAWPALPPRYPSGEKFPWAHAQLLRGKVVCFSRLEELPLEAASDREEFLRQGIKSKVALPLAANGEVFGALAFGTLAAERAWRDDELAALKLIAQIVSNVVARQRAELREEQLRNELAHAMRVATLGELAAALAHELNQPLAAILSNAQAARRFLDHGEMNRGELRAILDDIVRDDKRAGGVVHNLRQMASKQPAEREVCCLNDVARETGELMHAELVVQNIEVRFALASHLPRVRVARAELQQVLVNLLMNAMHAMADTLPGRRRIEIETRRVEESVTLTIRDEGHGISAERLAQVFEPFYSTKRGGLGIGLSICRRLIENHAGRIEAGNREAGGASFTLSLPQYRTKVR